MMANDRNDLGEERNRPDDARAGICVLLDPVELDGFERGGLEQDALENADLTDVVQQRRTLERRDLGRSEPELEADPARHIRHPERVSRRVAVLGVYRFGQRLENPDGLLLDVEQHLPKPQVQRGDAPLGVVEFTSRPVQHVAESPRHHGRPDKDGGPHHEDRIADRGGDRTVVAVRLNDPRELVAVTRRHVHRSENRHQAAVVGIPETDRRALDDPDARRASEDSFEVGVGGTAERGFAFPGRIEDLPGRVGEAVRRDLAGSSPLPEAPILVSVFRPQNMRRGSNEGVDVFGRGVP